MEKIGVRDLKTHASEIVRRVRDDNESFELTFRGEIVGKITPIGSRTDPDAAMKSWSEWSAFFDEVAAEISEESSLEETMRDIRRDV